MIAESLRAALDIIIALESPEPSEVLDALRHLTAECLDSEEALQEYMEDLQDTWEDGLVM